MVLACLALTLGSTVVRPSRGSDIDFMWMPFQAHFFATFDNVIIEAGESLIVNGVVTLLALAIAGRRGVAPAFWLVGGLAGVDQCWRVLAGAAAFDTTPFVFAIVGWWVAVRLWKGLQRVRPHGPTDFVASPASASDNALASG